MINKAQIRKGSKMNSDIIDKELNELAYLEVGSFDYKAKVERIKHMAKECFDCCTDEYKSKLNRYLNK